MSRRKGLALLVAVIVVLSMLVLPVTAVGISVAADDIPGIEGFNQFGALKNTPTDTRAGHTTTQTIAILTNSSVPNNARIVISFPAGFNLSAATLGTVTGVASPGTFTTSFTPSGVIIDRNGDGDVFPGGGTWINISLNNVKNANMAQSYIITVLTYLSGGAAALDGATSDNFAITPDDIHHYNVSAIVTPQTVAVPFSVTITARDQYNNLNTSADENVNLTFGFADTGATPTTTTTVSGTATVGSMTMMKSGATQNITFTGATSTKSGKSNNFAVDKHSTTTTVTLHGASYKYGTSTVRWNATVETGVAGKIATGKIKWYADATTYVGVTVLDATGKSQYYGSPCTLPVGTHAITAQYQGDSGFAASTSPAVNQQVAQKMVTVTGITADNKIYDGTTVATLNTAAAALNGIACSDAVTLSTTSAVGSFADAWVGTGKTVTVSGLVLEGADAGNYLLIQPTTTADITLRPITIVAKPDSKTYDGTNTSGLTPGVETPGDIPSAGFADGDALTIAVQTFDYKDYGTRSLKVTQPVTIMNDDAPAVDVTDQYYITYTDAEGYIYQRPLCLQAVTETRSYNGTTISGVDPLVCDSYNLDPSNTGIAPVDHLATLYQTFDSKDVSVTDGRLLTPYATIHGSDDGDVTGNYNIIQNNVSGTITVVSVTIHALDKTTVYCEGYPPYTYELEGTLYGSDYMYGYLYCNYESCYDSYGTYDILQGTLAINDGNGSVSPNYDVTFNSGTLNVVEAPIWHPEFIGPFAGWTTLYSDNPVISVTFGAEANVEHAYMFTWTTEPDLETLVLPDSPEDVMNSGFDWEDITDEFATYDGRTWGCQTFFQDEGWHIVQLYGRYEDGLDEDDPEYYCEGCFGWPFFITNTAFEVDLSADIQLVNGWNLISMPVDPSDYRYYEGYGDGSSATIPWDDDLDDILADVAVPDMVVWSYAPAYYDEYDGDWYDAEWYVAFCEDNGYWTDEGLETAYYTEDLEWYGDLDEMHQGQGFWVRMPNEYYDEGEDAWVECSGDTLTVYGSERGLSWGTPTTINLYKGWNLIGTAMRTDVDTNEFLYGCYENFRIMWTFNAITGWDSYTGYDDDFSIKAEMQGYGPTPTPFGPPTTETMYSAQGYWIYVNADDAVFPLYDPDLKDPNGGFQP